MATKSWPLHLLASVCLLAPGIYIFWPFIVGDALLLYKDIGSDSYNSYYADFLHLSNYIRSNGFPSWSFHIGMGQDLAYATGFLFWEPVSWLPGRFIAQALVYQHVAKVVIAGLIFFRFLQLRSLPIGVALFGALLLGYSGYMSVGACCSLLVEELLAFTMILLGIEQALAKGRWLLLVLSLAVVGMINPFYLYLAALFVGCYFLASLLARHDWELKKIIAGSGLLGGLGLLAVALGAIVTLPFLNVVLNSPRGAGATTNLATLSSLPVFGFESPAHYATAFLRLFSNDLLGTGNAFRGWQTYVEAPVIYCGLVCLLLFPQAFIGATRRQRIVYILFLAWLLVPTVFPWFRYLFWLFKGDYYRAYSLFCVLGTIYLSMVALTRYLEGGSLNLWLLGATTALLLGALYLPINAVQALVDPRLRIVVTIYLAAYAFLLLLGQLTKRQSATAYFVLLLAVVELSHFGRITVAERPTIQKSELSHGIAAPADLLNAVAQINRDDPPFLRITEVHLSARGPQTESNYPMLVGYYGTSSYSSFNDFNYIRFLAAVGALPSSLETDTRWTVGVTGNFVLSLFAGEKYVLAQDPGPFEQAPQYKVIGSYGSYSLLRNEFSIPLGLTYYQYLPENEFLELTQDGKEQALLAAAVLDPTEQTRAGRLQRTTVAQLQTDFTALGYPTVAEQRRVSGLQLTSFHENSLTGKVNLEKDGLLLLQTPFNPGWRAFQDGRPVTTVKADIGLLGVLLDAGEHNIQLRYRNPWLVPAAILTATSLLILLILRGRRPRLRIVGA